MCILPRRRWAFARLGYHPGDMLEVFSDQIIDQARMSQTETRARRRAFAQCRSRGLQQRSCLVEARLVRLQHHTEP